MEGKPDYKSIKEIISLPQDQIPPQSENRDLNEADFFKQQGFKEKFREDLEDQRSYRSLREKYANKSFWFLIGWTLTVVVFFALSGFGVCHFKLPDTVLALLGGSTTVSVLGLVALIIRGIFHPHKS